MENKERWFGKNICEICGCKIKDVLYDAQRIDSQEWTTMCRKCYDVNGAPVAWGSGQMYEEKDGVFYLAAGGRPDDEFFDDETTKITPPPDMDINALLRMFFKTH